MPRKFYLYSPSLSGGITTTFIVSAGLPPIFAFPCMLVSTILIGALPGGPLECLLLRRIYHKPEVLQLLVTFAIFMILEDVQRLVWGTQPIFQSTALQIGRAHV